MQQVHSLGETVDNGEYCVLAIGVRETGDEVQGDVGPQTMWDREEL